MYSQFTATNFSPKTPEENSPASPLHSDHDSAAIVRYITGIWMMVQFLWIFVNLRENSWLSVMNFVIIFVNKHSIKGEKQLFNNGLWDFVLKSFFFIAFLYFHPENLLLMDSGGWIKSCCDAGYQWWNCEDKLLNSSVKLKQFFNQEVWRCGKDRWFPCG